MDEHDKSEREDSEAHSAEDIEAAISKLSKSDRVGMASELLNVVGGAAAGASAAGAVAGAAGATTFLGSTTLAGIVGVGIASTPVGWIAGCVLAGGAAAYGVSKMIKSGGMNDQIRAEMVGRLNTRLQKLRHRSKAVAIPPAEAFRGYVDLAVADKSISAEQAHRIVALVESGKLELGLAIERIKQLRAGA